MSWQLSLTPFKSCTQSGGAIGWRKMLIPSRLRVRVSSRLPKKNNMENLQIKIIITDGEKEAIAKLSVDSYKQVKELHGISLLDDTVDSLLEEIEKSMNKK